MGKYIYWIMGILFAAALRVWLLFSAAVPFNSDEAIVALMARHITQGARPMFFYGQSYMGSIDAYLIAGGFSLFGESIWVIRVVQMLLYALFLYSAWLLAHRFLRDKRAAGMSILLMAVPPTLITTYTSATLGGYVELLIFGNLILLLGYEVLYGDLVNRKIAWIGLGFIGGLAFWTLGLSSVYLLSIVLLGIWNFRKLNWGGVFSAGAAFIVGSLPWWIENLTHQWAALSMHVSGSPIEIPVSTFSQRLVGFIFLGLPTILGFRRPWEGTFEALWIVFLCLLIFFGLVIFVIEARRRKLMLVQPGVSKLLLLFVAINIVVFVSSQFGIDSTGRYLIPLYPIYALGLGAFASWLSGRSLKIGWILVAILMGMNLVTNISAGISPDGLTTQIDPISRFDNQHDQALIDFLMENSLTRGYGNYWVTYRIAFLSGENIIYTPQLPYKENFSFTEKDNRYPAYNDLVAESKAPAIITTQHPSLDDLLEARWKNDGLDFKEEEIGPYHVYYSFSKPMSLELLQDYRTP